MIEETELAYSEVNAILDLLEEILWGMELIQFLLLKHQQ